MMAKRIFDICASLVVLMLTLPLSALAATAIAMGRDGPILFRQERIGQHGLPFQILKFRTMRTVHPENAAAITIGADPRITRVGHILRQTKIDELPQLFNVLTGQMSLVGPRPESAVYVALYPEEQRKAIQSVRPGITDRASIKYRNEAELLGVALNPDQYYRSVILPDKLAIGADYARSHSFWGDLSILIDTVRVVLNPDNQS